MTLDPSKNKTKIINKSKEVQTEKPDKNAIFKNVPVLWKSIKLNWMFWITCLISIFLLTYFNNENKSYVNGYITFIIAMLVGWYIHYLSHAYDLLQIYKNSDGKISDSENLYVEKEYFSIFKDYHYYTYIKKGTKDIELPDIKNFKTTIENHKICYSFEMEIKENIKDISFEFGDSDFYVAMILKDEFVDIKNISHKVSGVDNDFYYGYKLEFN